MQRSHAMRIEKLIFLVVTSASMRWSNV